MFLHVCEKCNKEFNKKSNYLTHINKKFSCNKNLAQNIEIVPKNSKNTTKNSKKTEKTEKTENTYINSELICKYCKKQFSRKDNLKKHFNRCKVKKQDENEKDLIFKQLLEKDRQINQLFEQNKEILQKYEETVKMNIILTKKLQKSKKTKNIKNIQNNTTNNQNNTINNQNNNINIQIVQFGKENLEKIDKKHYLNIFNDNRSNGYKFITDVVKSIHFNPTYPEFNNIYISDINREKCMVFDGKNWKLLYLDKENNIISEIIEKTISYSHENNDFIKKTYKNHKNIKNIENRVNIIEKTLNKCDNDNIIELIDENEENSSIKTQKILKEYQDFKNYVEDNVKLLLYNEKNNNRK